METRILRLFGWLSNTFFLSSCLVAPRPLPFPQYTRSANMSGYNSTSVPASPADNATQSFIDSTQSGELVSDSSSA